MNMTTHHYDNLLTLEIEFEDLDDVVWKFKKVKYSDLDFAQQPSDEEIAAEFLDTFSSDLEDLLRETKLESTYEIGFNNRDHGVDCFLRVDYKSTKIGKYKYKVMTSNAVIHTESDYE